MRRRSLLLAAALSGLAGHAVAVDRVALDLAIAALTADDERRRAAVEGLVARGKPDVVGALIDLMLYYPDDGDVIAAALRRFTGQSIGTDWFRWMLWQEDAPQFVSFDGYATFKALLFHHIDPNFADFLAPDSRHTIRVEEIVWGGVVKDGIPALVQPKFVSAEEADWLWDGEPVFGIEIDGDVRAYPHRIMDWHEMANDVVGGVPLALAYCTLCGSAVLYETTVPGRPEPFEFGSSGLLYRSNKLMYDRQTHSLWNHFTARPVVGPLVDSGIELRTRPVAVMRWHRWRERHPATRVLSLETGHSRDYSPGRPYGTYFTSPSLMFPTSTADARLSPKDIVFVVRVDEGLRAWPMRAFADGRVLSDAVGTRTLVLVGDGGDETVRAYDRGAAVFTSKVEGSAAAPLALFDDAGGRWSVSEEALTAPDGRQLARLAGHNAYWFAFARFVGGRGTLYEEPRPR
jgi:hypothetical protein